MTVVKKHVGEKYVCIAEAARTLGYCLLIILETPYSSILRERKELPNLWSREKIRVKTWLPGTSGGQRLHPAIPRGHYQSGAEQWDECVTFPTAGSGNLRNCSFIKHIRDSALFAYWYPWRTGIQRWGCECYLLYHCSQAARTVLFAL